MAAVGRGLLDEADRLVHGVALGHPRVEPRHIEIHKPARDALDHLASGHAGADRRPVFRRQGLKARIPHHQPILSVIDRQSIGHDIHGSAELIEGAFASARVDQQGADGDEDGQGGEGGDRQRQGVARQHWGDCGPAAHRDQGHRGHGDEVKAVDPDDQQERRRQLSAARRARPGDDQRAGRRGHADRDRGHHIARVPQQQALRPPGQHAHEMHERDTRPEDETAGDLAPPAASGGERKGERGQGDDDRQRGRRDERIEDGGKCRREGQHRHEVSVPEPGAEDEADDREPDPPARSRRRRPRVEVHCGAHGRSADHGGQQDQTPVLLRRYAREHLQHCRTPSPCALAFCGPARVPTVNGGRN